MIDHRFITTTFDLEGYRVVANCGIVRGIIVRSRSAIGNFAAGIQQFFGGNISLFTELCEQARQEAFDLMRQHAAEAGANAIIGMRYESNDFAPGVAEVLCYGTAVVVNLRDSATGERQAAIETAEPESAGATPDNEGHQPVPASGPTASP
jgi:uncharacterized protein YbjQ (UPF0145 family)